MIRFYDLQTNTEMELNYKDVDYVVHVLDGILIIDVEGKSYLAKTIFFE